MGIKIKSRGSWNRTQRALQSFSMNSKTRRIINSYGQRGVQYLKESTPKRLYKTAQSWYYEIDESNAGHITLLFKNSNEVKGVNIAIILQYGHGTRNGGYVQGIDYINPAAQKAFTQMADEIWTEVSSTWRK